MTSEILIFIAYVLLIFFYYKIRKIEHETSYFSLKVHFKMMIADYANGFLGEDYVRKAFESMEESEFAKTEAYMALRNIFEKVADAKNGSK